VIVVANWVIAIAYSPIAVASATKKKYGNLTGSNSHGQYGGLFAVVGVSLKQHF